MHLDVCDGCDGCGGRCTTGFTVTREEWESVREYLLGMPTMERERVRAQTKIVPWPGAEDTGATVSLCQFRDTERDNCSIYPARPTICRLFGQTGWLPCPIDAVPEYPADAPEVWDEYRRFERRTFEEWNSSLPRI
ncbi:MAG: YkgJ family cysteine cluster protein [Proteobacteria bacterium]|nr:MAG: YkgJ family cysteine cluster protein [Pseudomonadota bacterium]